jgi:uncharacterized repeat protein (TIGR01451 family)
MFNELLSVLRVNDSPSLFTSKSRRRPSRRWRRLAAEHLETRVMLSGSPNLGILTLDPTSFQSLDNAGSGGITVTGGDIVVDSSSSSAARNTGGGNVTANNIYLHGNLLALGSGKFVENRMTGSTPLADPLASLPVPALPGPTFTNTVINGKTVTIAPGDYVGGIQILGNSKVTFAAGLYYLKGGGLQIGGTSKVSGTGVTIYNAPTNPGDSIDITGSATVNLTAPSSGTYQGIVIFQNRTSSAPISISGSGKATFTGEIYAADALFDVSASTTQAIDSGGAGAIPGALVVHDLTVTGSGALDVAALAGGLTADLAVTITDNTNQGIAIAGNTVEYIITVKNNGPDAALGAKVSDTFPSFIDSDMYTIVVTGGAADLTHPAGGSGSIADTLDLPSGSTITYTVMADVDSATEGPQGETATVTAPPAVVDPIPANNMATDTISFSSPVTIQNWSGYVILPTASQVNSVGGTWVLPPVTTTGSVPINSAADFWVGIDSVSTVEQIGTAYGLIPGTVSTIGYYAWVELEGDVSSGGTQGPYAAEYLLNNFNGNNVNPMPGDTISASVTFVSTSAGKSTFHFVFDDTPQGGPTKSWTGNLTTSYVQPIRSTGEWISEALSLNGVTEATLANFGTVNFSGCWATVGTTTGPISAFPNQQVDMSPLGSPNLPVPQGGTDTTTEMVDSNIPGPLEPSGDGSSSFSVTFVSANL